jgi:hypothetical protein
VTLLGLVASNNPAVRHQVLEAVAHQVPIIGNQLTGSVQQLRRSSIIGLIVLTWGATGLAQAGLFTMEQVWNLPGPARPGYFQRLGRAVVFLAVLGFGVVVTTGLTSLGLYGHGPGVLDVAGEILVAATNIGMFFLSFRVLTPKGVPTRKLVPGAAAGGLAWTVLQALGTYVVGHLRETDAAYGAFATVLVLLGGSPSAWQSPCTPPSSMSCWPEGYGHAPSSSPRSPKPTGLSWPCRHCKTRGATTSASTSPTTTCRATQPRPPISRAPPMRSPRPQRPTRAARPTSAAPASHLNGISCRLARRDLCRWYGTVVWPPASQTA